MFKINKDWLVCPITKESLTEKNGSLMSSAGTYCLNDNHNFWNFIPSNLKELDSPLWKVWEELQHNGVVSYQNSPTNNIGVGPRKDFLQFAEFCDFSGLVLDIGVGPQKVPTHIEYNEKENVTFIGIDPLEGAQPRPFAYIQALGEYLPFKDNLFDQVLFVTSLDHFIDPSAALSEAKRVVKKTGNILIWLGEKDKNAPKPAESPEWYKSLRIPEGAEDPFHYRRFSLNDFRNYLKNLDLKIIKEKVIEVDPWRKNCFFRISK